MGSDLIQPHQAAAKFHAKVTKKKGKKGRKDRVEEEEGEEAAKPEKPDKLSEKKDTPEIRKRHKDIF